jgi:Rrf2 family iron-sulfur cluster assembly transcriptional regulator
MRAVVLLACHDPEEMVSAGKLAKETGVPKNYLSTVLHTLGKANITVGIRGPGGGFRLARAAKRITAQEVIGLFDDPNDRRRCLLGLRTCCPESPCKAHSEWMKVWSRYERFLKRTTIDRMISPTFLRAAVDPGKTPFTKPSRQRRVSTL